MRCLAFEVIPSLCPQELSFLLDYVCTHALAQLFRVWQRPRSLALSLCTLTTQVFKCESFAYTSSSDVIQAEQAADLDLKTVVQEWEAMMGTFKAAVEERVAEELNPMVYPQVRSRCAALIMECVEILPVGVHARPHPACGGNCWIYAWRMLTLRNDRAGRRSYRKFGILMSDLFG